MCSAMAHLFYRSWQHIGKIMTPAICSAPAKKEEIWWQILGSVLDAVIYGNITSLLKECGVWLDAKTGNKQAEGAEEI